MKYMLMFVRNDETFLNDPELQSKYAQIGQWFEDLGARGKFESGYELQPMANATTVHWDGDRPIVTDGPFMETKEHIGGYAIVEAADLDEAIAVAESWPEHSHKLEIRPLIGHDDH